MPTQPIQPQPGRRPVYPVDADAQGPGQPHHEDGSQPVRRPDLPPPDAPDDPASDAATESANHPNDE
jgi:hypothetical protein